VGNSSKARESVSLNWVKTIAREEDPNWKNMRTRSGLSSGEGLIHAVRDPIIKTGADGEKMFLLIPAWRRSAC
jgi:hypothetical protein